MEAPRSRSTAINAHRRSCYGGTKVENHWHELIEKIMLWKYRSQEYRDGVLQKIMLWKYGGQEVLSWSPTEDHVVEVPR